MPESKSNVDKLIDQFIPEEADGNKDDITVDGGDANGEESKKSESNDSGQTATDEQEGQDDAKGNKDDGAGQDDGQKSTDESDKAEGSDDDDKDQNNNAAARSRDLVDIKTGEVIAKAGKERRNYEHYAVNNFHKAARKVVEMEAEIKTLKELPNIGQKYDLNPEQVDAGVQLMAQLRDNPKQAIATMIGEAKKKNIDLSDLGLSVQSNDVKELLESYLGPIKNSTENVKKEEEVINAARAQSEQFFGKYPEAQLHEAEIAGIITEAGQRGARLSAEDAYIALQKWANTRKIDLTKPIAPQVEAMANASGNDQNGNSESKKTTPKKPLPSGGRGTKTEALSRDESDPDENASYKDIIAMSMREAGMNVN